MIIYLKTERVLLKSPMVHILKIFLPLPMRFAPPKGSIMKLAKRPPMVFRLYVLLLLYLLSLKYTGDMINRNFRHS